MVMTILLALGLAVSAATDKPMAIADFSLPQINAGEWSLADQSDSKLIVVTFLGTECPLARLYSQRLEELRQVYADKGVLFVGIDANSQDSFAEMVKFAEEARLQLPLLKDTDGKVADLFGAQRTPEVFVLDENRTVRYRGRIDDQHTPQLRGAKARRNDLVIALDELLAGKSVSQPQTEAPGCLIGRRKEVAPKASVTYTKDIAPLLNRHCVECHRAGEIGPFAMSDYDEVAGWAETIFEVVNEGRMPPWFASPDHGKFENDSRLSQGEKYLLKRWVEEGCPEGEPGDLPPLRQFTNGWNIPEPDIVLPMANQPFRIPATGAVDYKHFVVDPGFTEDKWIVATEVRPGNRAVVHHVLVYVQSPDKSVFADAIKGSLLGAYAPGAPGRALPPGTARRVPAGSKIILQMHYTTNGIEQEDLSSLGLKFCDVKDVKQELESGWATNFFLAIPPRAPNHPIKATFAFPEDRWLYQMTPHMHLRGKSFRYTAQYPDGTTEILLDVPKFDFSWQIDYVLDKPKFMPKGTTLLCEATFDNSPGNLANPDPNRFVTFGEQTWDEMMIGWFTSAKDRRPSGVTAATGLRP